MRELRRERETRAAAGPGEALRSEDAMTLLIPLTSLTAAAATEEVSRLEGGLAAGQEPAAPVKLGSFGANAAPEGTARGEEVASGCEARFVQRLRGGASSGGCVGCASAPPARSAAARRATPAATDTSFATANPAAGGNHGRDARATGMLRDRSCETKPMCMDTPATAERRRALTSLRAEP